MRSSPFLMVVTALLALACGGSAPAPAPAPSAPPPPATPATTTPAATTPAATTPPAGTVECCHTDFDFSIGGVPKTKEECDKSPEANTWKAGPECAEICCEYGGADGSDRLKMSTTIYECMFAMEAAGVILDGVEVCSMMMPATTASACCLTPAGVVASEFKTASDCADAGDYWSASDKCPAGSPSANPFADDHSEPQPSEDEPKATRATGGLTRPSTPTKPTGTTRPGTTTGTTRTRPK